MISKKTKLKKVLELGKKCKKCGHCCSHGSGALADDDLKKIAKFLKTTEEELKKTCLEDVERFNTKRPVFHFKYFIHLYFYQSYNLSNKLPFYLNELYFLNHNQ